MRFTLEYWKDDDWYVGRLREVPGVFSQGRTLDALEENVRDAYRLMLREQQPRVRRRNARLKAIAIPSETSGIHPRVGGGRLRAETAREEARHLHESKDRPERPGSPAH